MQNWPLGLLNYFLFIVLHKMYFNVHAVLMYSYEAPRYNRSALSAFQLTGGTKIRECKNGIENIHSFPTFQRKTSVEAP